MMGIEPLKENMGIPAPSCLSFLPCFLTTLWRTELQCLGLQEWCPEQLWVQCKQTLKSLTFSIILVTRLGFCHNAGKLT